MKKKLLTLAMASALAVPFAAQGEAKVKISEDTGITLGFRLQTFYLHNDDDVVSPSDENEFLVRRARLRLKGDITKYFSAFLQTEFANDNLRDPNQIGLSGGGVRLIDAFVTVKPWEFFQINAGELMSPASRQNTTSSGAMMAWDRTLQNNKTLTWGTRSVGSLQTRTLGFTNAGLKGDVDVRDLGVTLFGFYPFSDLVSGKYYVGVYQGSDQTFEDKKRFTGRLQVNLFDSEPGYYNNATYFGKKKTIAIGAAYDMQDDVARDVTGAGVDYRWYSIDAFAEYPLGPGSFTLEGAYNDLDLDGAGVLVSNFGQPNQASLSATSAKQAEGDGFYVETGYFIPALGGLPGGWQPWFLYEKWDAGLEAGSYDAYRAGLTYVFKGHNANVKFGYEKIDPEGEGLPDIDTFGVGVFMNY